MTMYNPIALRTDSTQESVHTQPAPQLWGIFPDPEAHTASQLKLVCYFGCNVLKGNGGPRDPLEADPIQREPR